MRKFLIFLGLLCFSHFVVLLAQDRHRIDSLKTVLATQREDTNKVKTYAELGWAYQWSSPDTAISYGQTGVALAKKLRYDRGLFTLLVSLSEALATKGNYSTALAYRYQLPDIAQKLNDKELLAQAYALIGTVFFYAKDYQRALHYCLRAKEIGVAPFGKAEILLGFIGEAYFHLNQLDSAYVYLKKAYELDVKSSNYHWAIPYYYLAAIDVKKGHPAKAIDLYRKSIQLEIEKLSLLKGYNGIAEAFRQNGQMDSALIYARQSVQMGMAASVLDPVVDATALLVNIYGAKGETDSVLKYQSLMLAAKDSLYSSDKVRQLENVAFNESLRQQEIMAEQKQYKNRLLLYGLAVILIAALIVGAVLYRSNGQKKKANTLLEQQKQEIEKQKREAEIEAALEKVRGRSISMQKSDELKDVIQLVNQQLLQLNIFVQHAGFVIDYKETDDMHVWLADPFAMPYQVVVPYFDSAIWNSYNEAKKNGNNFFALQLSFEEKNKFYRDMFALIPGIPDDAKKYYAECPGLAISMVLLDNIALYIENFSGIPYTNEENATLMRFGKVFQQTYTRFLDLQKAEALALQAQQDLLEIKAARKKAEEALTELRATQQQLVQQEKMASLGELTAGIAHEIQNPLNFVNNFAEVNQGLLDELEQASERRDWAEVQDLVKDIRSNEEKINHHGRRADSIVKNMLQHARGSTGNKQLTDINALVDEYLRLAYHGCRSKDKCFAPALCTSYADGLAKINVVPQEIGRVLLNLFNNAFYAISEKVKLGNATFEPTVWVNTKAEANKVTITVKDNGTGMPLQVKEKVFQPFFTTKPTGVGTGLGLSLSYDIVTKGHGGELYVESKEGEGTAFLIVLPVQ